MGLTHVVAALHQLDKAPARDAPFPSVLGRQTENLLGSLIYLAAVAVMCCAFALGTRLLVAANASANVSIDIPSIYEHGTGRFMTVGSVGRVHLKFLSCKALHQAQWYGALADF